MYRWRKYDVSGVINKLFNKYKIEGVAMPYTFEDFKREYDNAISPNNSVKETASASLI